MKIAWGAGRWLVTLAILLGLGGHATPYKTDVPENDAQVASVVHLARSDLQDRLSIQDEVIAVESIRAFTFPCPDPDICQGRLSGYIVRLAVDNLVYEYNARIVGELSILWHEVSDRPTVRLGRSLRLSPVTCFLTFACLGIVAWLASSQLILEHDQQAVRVARTIALLSHANRIVC